MTTYSYDANNFPSHEEFVKQLREGSESYDPVEELLSLERELMALEREHGASSAEFYDQYQAGETGDSIQIVTWVAKYQLYLHLKKRV